MGVIDCHYSEYHGLSGGGYPSANLCAKKVRNGSESFPIDTQVAIDPNFEIYYWLLTYLRSGKYESANTSCSI